MHRPRSRQGLAADLVARRVVTTVYREDEDAGLEASWRLGIETVPTLVRGDERIVGWDRSQWEGFTGISGLGDGLPEILPEYGRPSARVTIPESWNPCTARRRFLDSIRSVGSCHMPDIVNRRRWSKSDSE